jgi:predicted nucleic acid-binding protein
MTAWRLDTGPLLAALDRRDPDHSRCVAALATFSGSLLTTGAVVAEAMHFLAGRPGTTETRIGFLDDAPVDIRDCFAPLQLHAATRLMKKYADTPMDFADATLVLRADETGSNHIVTLDERGFRTFRFHNTRRFLLVLTPP